MSSKAASGSPLSHKLFKELSYTRSYIYIYTVGSYIHITIDISLSIPGISPKFPMVFEGLCFFDHLLRRIADGSQSQLRPTESLAGARRAQPQAPRRLPRRRGLAIQWMTFWRWIKAGSLKFLMLRNFPP